MTGTKQEPLDLWTQFHRAFEAEIRGTSDEDLYAAWQKPSRRTKLYAGTIVPKIASHLGLSDISELFKVDWVMRTPCSTGEFVPVVFVESENVAKTAGHEMRKLCAISCPLAVLITVIEWNPTVFPKKASRDRLMTEWERIIKAHYEIWPRQGTIGVIVGEWGPNNFLRFYSLAYSTQGEICDQPSLLFEKPIGTIDTGG